MGIQHEDDCDPSICIVIVLACICCFFGLGIRPKIPFEGIGVYTAYFGIN